MGGGGGGGGGHVSLQLNAFYTVVVNTDQSDCTI